MGYYTRYEIKTNGDTKKVVKALCCASRYHNLTDEAVKWYEHEDDCRTVSQDFPETLITVIGKGENDDDFWVKYFKNGRMQRGKAWIAYEEFDESKLS